MNKGKVGTLYVVATPIGNLDDITLRAINVLKNADKILAEDTRHASFLLRHHGISTSMISLHDHNERDRAESLIEHLQKGEAIALISDAGTPLICDPGFYLVRAVKAAGLNVVPIPGPSALITALSAAGLPTDKFSFEGFVPVGQEARVKFFKELAHHTHTMVFYEAPHRLIATLDLMRKVLGDDRQMVIARELTKMYETIKLDTIAGICEHFAAHADEVRGEIVLLLAGSEERQSETVEIAIDALLDSLLAELPLKQAVALASQMTGRRKNELYDLAIARKK